MDKYIIGLMSGTSLDGLDIIYVRFNSENITNYSILSTETYQYDDYWRQQLNNAYHFSASDLYRLDAAYGFFLGKKVLEFIHKNNIKQVDLISSHGQTIFHNPEESFTTQIGNGAYINAITKIKTISDFRTQDMALGGQGAPLVPIGDQVLFGSYQYCLNIGGFANVSFEKNQQRIAFDICPANIVLNYYAKKLEKTYDENGNIARSGKLIPELLKELNNISFYKEEKPKSLGWEFVESEVIPLIKKNAYNISDILHTYTEHIAIQIAKRTGKGKMLITGGGAHNQYLVSQIKKYSSADIIIPDKTIIDFKEALIFALLGLLREQNKINILASVTGSEIDHSSGVIYNAYKK